MRALIVASASREAVTDPASTWATNSFTRSLPRSRAAASRVNRPSSMIWSSRPFSLEVSWAEAAAEPCCASAIVASLGFVQVQFAAQLFQLIGVGERFHQQVVQLVVALQAAAKVRKL